MGLLFWKLLPFLFQTQYPLAPLSEELGCSPTLSFLSDPERYRQEGPFYYFDPLQLAGEDSFARYREAELKHGRVAMLAMTEVIAVPLVKRLGGLPRDFCEGIAGRSAPFSVMDYVKVLAVCGALEIFVFVQRNPRDMPGDYGVGFFGIRDKTANEKLLWVELENGRLAMMGITGFIISDFITHGKPWLEQWLGFMERWVDLAESI